MKTRHLILGVLLFGSIYANAQNFTTKLDNPQPGLPEMDVILMSFGADYPIKVGTLEPNGELRFNFDTIDISHIPQAHLDMFMTDMVHATFKMNCGTSNDFPEFDNKMAASGGYFGLWHKNRWAGTIYALSDKDLLPWLEDEAYMEPVKGSFFELLYISEAVKMQKECINNWQLASGNFDATYAYDIELSQGFNLIEYQIQAIHKTNPNETSSKPSKIVIQKAKDLSSIIWTAKYF